MAVPELEIYGDIGENWWGEGLTGKYVASWLKAYANDAAEVTVRINSPGGWVSEGIAIHNILASHKARVKVLIDGFALSAASVIAMAGDEIQMMPGSIYMIHNASGGCRGTAEDMEVVASALRKMSDSIADIYAQRTGKTKEECAALMQAETWFTTSEALAAGLCDSVLPGKRRASEIKGATDKKTQRASAKWLETYKNMPDEVRQAYTAMMASIGAGEPALETEPAQAPEAPSPAPRAPTSAPFNLITTTFAARSPLSELARSSLGELARGRAR
jgi:ATP-dependent Clp endopeptidase proteolytic subunit ClpP